MDLKGSITYDATVDAVITMLRDPEVTRELYESLGHRDVEVLECGEDDGVLRIRSSQVVDVDLPGFAKRVLKPTNTMVQTDEWRKGTKGAWDGTFDVEVKGAPIHISGTMRLAPAGKKCKHEIDIDVNVKVPLVGGRIAEWAGKGEVQQTLDGQLAFYKGWLAEHSQA
jgi:hypothetical protein